MVFHGARLVFHGSMSVFMVFHGPRLVFHGSRSVFTVFHGSRMVFHFSRSERPKTVQALPAVTKS